MKRVVKILLNILIFFYFILTIAVTYCLKSYNKYDVVEFKDKYLIPANEYMEKYDDNSLIMVKKDKDYVKGDYAFYYDTYNTTILPKLGKIQSVTKITDKEFTVTFDNDIILSSENVLGSQKNSKEYKHLGNLFKTLTSEKGYLLYIIFPMLLGFIYEAYSIIKEVKKK